MNLKIRLFLFLILSVGGGWSQELALPDTIIFKPGATLPPSVKGSELKCSIVSETETSIRVDRSVTKGISDMQEISKDAIAEIRRADPGERRFQDIKATFKMPEDSQEPSYYTQILEEELEPFVSKFETSKYVPEVQKMMQQMKEELDKVYLSQVRRGEQWMTSQEWKDLQKEFEPRDLFKQIQQAKKDQDLTLILEHTKKIGTDHPSIYYPELVQNTIQLLDETLQGVTADVFVNRFKDQLVLIEGRLDTQNALLTQETNKAEKKAIQGRLRDLQKQKTQITTQINQVEKSFGDLQKKFIAEGERLRKIDLSKKKEAAQGLAGAAKLRGNPDAVDALVGEIQKAAKLWPGCTGIWSLALAEASDRIDAAALAVNENRLGDAEAELKKALSLLGAAGNLPLGVAAVKKQVGDDLRFFGPSKALMEVVQAKNWDKFTDKYTMLEKALVAPKPLDYPVSHRFSKAAAGWMQTQQKAMSDTMAESDAMVAKFYGVVKDVGFIAASENLLKAKELWSSNPKIAAANAEFKGELEKIVREKKIASLKPLVDAVDQAFEAHKLKEVEAAIKKLETTYPQHPDLEKMKFKLKNEKERLVAEEKARQEAAELARIEQEKQEKMKSLMIYGGISLVVFIGIIVGLVVWIKKRKQQMVEIPVDDGNDAPPTVG